ncbi:hypothetical protein K432DRAFT_379850 [Lepidopterella palustris CBS 459.81]|uniref:Uncharacterized protein n=1 Tax=Lepidopterella palustris CBS 459.81 TaxID=1314670 RepID=A0A8E2EFM0_9PEZI|nr:hypothetical protein K432DRAFT_379850 [Lepidopterella palustris CBS 459.81]
MAPAATTTSSVVTTTSSATATATSSPARGDHIGAATIVAVTVFVIYLIAGIVTCTLWFIDRRQKRARLPPTHRPAAPYRPFGRNSTASSSLLANAAESPEADDKASMFSRDRSASNATVTIYVPDQEDPRLTSTSSVNLIPLHVTPMDERRNPMDRTISNGSRLSIHSKGSGSQEESGEGQDLGVSRTRPRSISTNSARYYDPDSTPTSVPEMPASWRSQDGLSARDASGGYQRI